jgi:HPt (histidine-containing phosphotransfer) domain-containing protein
MQTQITPSTTSATAALDPQALQRLRDMAGSDDPELFSLVLQMFQQDAGHCLTHLREAIASQNADQLQKAAHALKGASAQVGACRLVLVCRSLEEVGLAANWINAVALRDQLEVEFQRVHAEIDTILAGGPA